MATKTKLRERSLIQSAEQVRALLGGETQLRIPLKPQPEFGIGKCYFSKTGWSYNDSGGRCTCDPFPNGFWPGDRIWIKETWADVNTEEGPAILYRATSDYQSWRDFSTVFDEDYGVGPSMSYDAYPGQFSMWWSDLLNGSPDHSWRSPVHMPRWASRITLEATDVKVDRDGELWVWVLETRREQL